MQKILTAEEMREVDRLTTEKYGIPSILLMENAAHAAARIITEKLGGSVKGKSFLILCGKGNNGGDGAALGRILWTQGANISIALTANVEDTKGDAKTNFEVFLKIHSGIRFSRHQLCLYEPGAFRVFFDDYQNLISQDAIIDALFGTGLTKPLEDSLLLLAKMIASLEKQNKTPLRVSLDLPSGLNSDLANQIGENFQADLTVTFTAPKLANVLPPASNFNGELVIANIGSPQELIDNSPSKTFLAEKEDAQSWLEQTKFTNDSYKNKRGHALLIVGSREYTGAAVLAANAAMLSGVGLTTVATSESAKTAIAAKVLEEVITRALPETKNGTISERAFAEIKKLAEKVDVIGIGCGLGKTGGSPRVSKGANVSERESNEVENLSSKNAPLLTRGLLPLIIENRKTPVVIDADGLNALAPFDLAGSEEFPLILTPHEGEFLRLLGTKNKDAIKDRVKAVRDFAEKHNVILVLKGERGLIGAPDGRVVVNPTGNSGLGKAGNGDTLTGIITGFIAQAVQMKVDIFETVVAAVYISGLAGDIAAKEFGHRSMLASDVRKSLREAFRRLEK